MTHISEIAAHRGYLRWSLAHTVPNPSVGTEKPPEIPSTSNFCRGRNPSYPIIRTRICRDKVVWVFVRNATRLAKTSSVGTVLLETLRPYGKQRNDDSNKAVMTVMDGIDNRSSRLLSPPSSRLLSLVATRRSRTLGIFVSVLSFSFPRFRTLWKAGNSDQAANSFPPDRLEQCKLMRNRY